MKILSFKILIVPMIFISQLVFGQFEKEIHFAYPVDEVASMTIEHKFGSINFVDTRDDSVVVDITIRIENVNEKKAEYLSEQLEFDIDLNGDNLKAKTIFGNKFSNVKEFSIDYTINIPIDRSLHVSNKFGNIKLDDLNAKGVFEVKYGNITGGRLVSETSPIEIELDYGKAIFDFINELNASVSYSKLMLDGVENADLDTKYSGITIDELTNLAVESKYDRYNIDKVEKVTGESKFTNWNIDELTDQFIFENEYGDIHIDYIAATLDKIIVDNEYGKLWLGIDENASYFLKGETKYCEISYPDFEPVKKIKDNNYTYLEVYVGNDETDVKVNITSKYGNVYLTR